MSYSQLSQDVKVLQHYLYKKNGIFIEIGANDGITLSNTFLLEKEYGWKGICIEPIPEKFEILKKNRPNSICVDKAVYSMGGVKLEFSDADLYSGITKHIDEINNDGKNGKKIIVETVNLNELLDMHNFPSFIDYLSIDTEGSEYEILNSINFNKYSFGIIHVEHNFVEPRRTQIRNLLLEKDYSYGGANQWDDIYVKNKR